MDIVATASATSRGTLNLLSNMSLVNDLALPLLVTFLTYLGSQHFLKPVSKWRELKDKLIVATIQYANYMAYSYVNKEGKRKFEDRGMINTVEQKLRRLAGEVCTLSNNRFYDFWKRLFLPNEKLIDEIRGDLIGWANSLIEKDGHYDPGREARIESLKKHLGLPNYYYEVKEMQNLKHSKK